MAHRTWKYGILLGLVGVALASGCVVKSGDGDDDSGGEGGESGSAGSSSGGKGGSSTGGKGGSATGGSSGSTTGGSSGSATGGSSGSATGGSSGTANTDPECDPDMGELDNTPFPNCEPTNMADPDPCEVCIEENCCAESQVCYGFDPGNVCGWGGIDLDDDDVLDGEITCYVACAQAYVEENEVYDSGAVDECTGMCATEECGLIGNATQDLVVCIEGSCETECFGS
jgi:hypothetical protein